jgi:hypothetical protein
MVIKSKTNLRLKSEPYLNNNHNHTTRTDLSKRVHATTHLPWGMTTIRMHQQGFVQLTFLLQRNLSQLAQTPSRGVKSINSNHEKGLTIRIAEIALFLSPAGLLILIAVALMTLKQRIINLLDPGETVFFTPARPAAIIFSAHPTQTIAAR